MRPSIAVPRIRLRQTHHSPEICQEVFGSVFGFASDNDSLALGLLALSNLSGNLYNTDDLPLPHP
jgi:hypothetical protein